MLNKKRSIAYSRLKFDELLANELSIEIIRKERKEKKAYSIMENDESKKILNNFIASLDFELTEDQKKVSFEILNDLSKNYPMNRLLQGDVGSGKTIVAVIAAIQVISCNKQVALMTPTEILTEQHFQTIKKMV